VSLLPSFALPYRLLNSELVGRFFTGPPLAGAAQRWQGLLHSYRTRVERFCPQLIAHLGLGLGRAPPQPAAGREVLAWLIRLDGRSLPSAFTGVTSANG
jgi:hypothetical protein